MSEQQVKYGKDQPPAKEDLINAMTCFTSGSLHLKAAIEKLQRGSSMFLVDKKRLKKFFKKYEELRKEYQDLLERTIFPQL